MITLIGNWLKGRFWKIAPWLISFLVWAIIAWQPYSYMRSQLRTTNDTLFARTKERDSLISRVKTFQLRESNVERNYYESLYRRQQELEKLVNSVAVVSLRQQKQNIKALIGVPAAPVPAYMPQIPVYRAPTVIVRKDTVCYDSTTNSMIYARLLESEAIRKTDSISIRAYEQLKLDYGDQKAVFDAYRGNIENLALCSGPFCFVKHKLRKLIRKDKANRRTADSFTLVPYMTRTDTIP